GPTLLARAALPHLKRTRGSISNVSSTFGHRPSPGAAHYGASKAALEHLTRPWALELAADGVRVNAVAPGPTETPMLERSGLTPEQVAAIKEAEAQRIPLGRRGEPEEVARWIVLLASPESAWVTGQVVGVDGGGGAPGGGGVGSAGGGAGGARGAPGRGGGWAGVGGRLSPGGGRIARGALAPPRWWIRRRAWEATTSPPRVPGAWPGRLNAPAA